MAKEIIICDTDVIIDYWDSHKHRHSNTLTLIENNIGLDSVAISAITKMELLLGATNKTDLAKVNKSLGRFNIILLSNDITLKAFELLQKYSLSHGLLMPDCIIAATALCLDMKLFTYNTKDYKFITGLHLYAE